MYSLETPEVCRNCGELKSVHAPHDDRLICPVPWPVPVGDYQERPPRRTIVRYVDRSRTQEYQRCHRARWWGYEYRGLGIVRRRASIPLTIGTYVHMGLENLLKQSQTKPYEEIDVEKAVTIALDGYDDLVQSRGLDVEPNTQESHTYNECKAMIESHIRMYYLRPLKPLLDEFIVLEVEQEDELPLAVFPVETGSYHSHDGLGGSETIYGAVYIDLRWMSRADGLLRRKADGDLYVLSFKTAKDWEARKEAENSHDMQGISEAAAINYRLEKRWKELQALPFLPQDASEFDGWLRCLSTPPRIAGVKMEFLIKGERRKDKKTGMYTFYSPFTRCWVKAGRKDVADPSLDEPDEYAWSWDWDEIKPNGFTVGHRLGKGFEMVNTWNLPGGVKGWIDMLNSGKVQPLAGDCLEKQVVLPIPYMRADEDIDRWRRQVISQEIEVAERSWKIGNLTGASFEDIEPMLDTTFQPYRRSCDWPARCTLQGVCYEGCQDDPLENGYVWRTPHHKPELVQLEKAA